MSRWTSNHTWPRLVSPHRHLWLAAALALTAAAAAGAQAPGATPTLVTELVSLQHRSAAAAVAEIESLLSPLGSVELQPHGNALVIRDTPDGVRRIVARLREIDRAPRRVRLDVQIVRAGTEAADEAAGRPQLPADLVRRLRELLRFESFALLAEAGLEMMEGERVAYQFGGDYRVEFELGVLGADGQLRLRDFIVGRGGAQDGRTLIHTNLNLTLERPMVLGLAQTEDSERALMVVLTSRLMEEAR
jgi:Bacterial type II/III secretion system short domain